MSVDLPWLEQYLKHCFVSYANIIIYLMSTLLGIESISVALKDHYSFYICLES